MRSISTDEKKLVAIMEKYGCVYTYQDNTDHCLIMGRMPAIGNTWTYAGNSGNVLRFDKKPSDISPVEETYMALKDIMLDMVKAIQGEKDASYKCQ